MSIIIPLSDYTNSIKRIDDHGSNCNIDDIITWFQDGTRDKKEEEGQQFGKIKKINQKSLSVNLFKYILCRQQFILKPSKETGIVCKNNLLYTRTMHVIKSNRFR